MAQKLHQQVKDVGSKLENRRPPRMPANCLSEVDQSPLPSMLESMKGCLNAIAKPELLKHQDKDVRVLVATCVCEITRITAPEAPYSDDVLRDIFHLIVGTFSGLGDINSPSFGKRVVILETLARYRSCVVMLDLECNDLINEMFSTFFAVVSDEHAESVLTSMQTIMLLILEESEDIPENLLFAILSVLGHKREASHEYYRTLCCKAEPFVKQFLISFMSGDNSSSNISVDYHEVIYDIYRCAPQILDGVVPYITGELLTDQLDVRLKAVKLLGELFSSTEHPISESFRPLFSEFLKRLTDRVVEVRVSVIEHVKNFLILNPSRPEAPDIISALCDRLLDYDEQVREKVVAAMYDIASHELTSISSQTSKQVAERLRDKSLKVKKYTMERLAELYKLYCLRSSDVLVNADEFEWIPGKILRCLYDRDFRSEDIESILCGSLFPPEFNTKEKVKHWVTIFSGFDKTEVKALEQILMQKQRIHQEMRKYLSLRQTCQDNDAPDYKKILASFRIMSRSFSDPPKAEESFQILNQLKDANIWKILTLLLDPSTSFDVAWGSRDELLKILGEKHPLYDFMVTFSVRCSYLLFNKEHVKEILAQAVAESGGDPKFVSSCMSLLPDNDIIKEGITHILAKAGGAIREQLAKASSSVDLLLEGLCLEGTRGQAKYSVQALASITKDDGLKSLSVLYKRLVDMLEERTHLPAILQSLGCIAQTAMPIFETREGEIIEFITHNILECNSKTQKKFKHTDDWNERSEVCLLKIFGIKTLVRSYLPTKDALLRSGIENLLGILRNILSFGEISNSIKSSAVDKSHLRLASAKAILRLSKLWESKIPLDIFYLTLGTSQDMYPQCRKLFLSKVHQYIKERLLDPKYTCAFLFNVVDSEPNGSLEGQHNLLEIFQVCNTVKARQLIMQSDANTLTSYPEYILVYLVHALAHHPTFPDINKYKHIQLFEPIYRLTAVVSIFQSIKQSGDIVINDKSKNSHALCDLGLSIVKHLCHEKIDVEAMAKPVTLPEQLYKPLEKEDASHLVDTAVSEDHKVLKESDEDGAELPLGEIMKNFKSQAAKKRKMAKKQAADTGLESLETDIDVLGMVREINLDNQETLPDMDSGRPDQDLKYLLNEGKATKSTEQKNGKDEAPVCVSGLERKSSPSPSMPPPGVPGPRREAAEPPSKKEHLVRILLSLAWGSSSKSRGLCLLMQWFSLKGPNGTHVVGTGEKDTQMTRRERRKGTRGIDQDSSESDDGTILRPAAAFRVWRGVNAGAGGAAGRFFGSRRGDDSENEPLSVWRRRAAKSG
ncbi:unnamed protein product [Spirodela intermedia]|uniref:Uncharacterized protein n=1 Tax=Spirodela intermedia TaxID=51605 RepID=A0A7I8JKI8_SPIIN|nr:unnamed protein product [Spirodela intermedia]CAA6670696.1 unnamed protein product [Spirodela intermedia]